MLTAGQQLHLIPVAFYAEGGHVIVRLRGGLEYELDPHYGRRALGWLERAVSDAEAQRRTTARRAAVR